MSVVIVTYTQEKWVAASVTSAVTQDYPNLEVIVADDASADRTPEIIDQIAREHPRRVVPILASSRVGMSGNLNRGLRVAKGKYVAFGAGDDLYLPGKIRAQVAWLEADPGRVLCGHRVEPIDDEDRPLATSGSRFGVRSGCGAEAVIRRGPPFASTSAMVRAEAMPARGFDERLTFNADWRFWIDCLRGGGEYAALPATLGRYRVHAHSLTGGITRDAARAKLWFDETMRTLAELEAETPVYRSAVRSQRARQYSYLSWRALQSGDGGAARGYARAALRQSPCMGTLGWISLVLSHGPSRAASISFKARSSLAAGRARIRFRSQPDR